MRGGAVLRERLNLLRAEEERVCEEDAPLVAAHEQRRERRAARLQPLDPLHRQRKRRQPRRAEQVCRVAPFTPPSALTRRQAKKHAKGKPRRQAKKHAKGKPRRQAKKPRSTRRVRPQVRSIQTAGGPAGEGRAAGPPE
jgi:hypothetical protein